MKRPSVLLLVLGVIVVLLLIAAAFFFLNRSGEPGTEQAFFPSSGDRTFSAATSTLRSSEQAFFFPDHPEDMEDAEVTIPVSNSGTKPPTASAPSKPRTPFDIIADLYARFRGGPTGSAGTSVSTNGSGTGVPYAPTDGIGTTYVPGQGSTDSSDSWIDGRPSGGDDEDLFRFDPETGDLWVGNVHFVFRGGAHLPDNSTSDVVGDPDNMVAGTTIGVLIGSLFGDPGLGLAIGTALGSNLYDGFTLQDFDISFDEGMPSFGGNSLGGDEEGEGGEGGEGKGFGGAVTGTAECTCSVDSYKFEISGTSQYTGTYVVTATTEKYGSKKTVGNFNVLGLYTEGTGSGLCMRYVGESCEEVNISKGLITQYSSSED